VTDSEMKQIAPRLQRSQTLRKYDLTIQPLKPRGR
jgi:hypothetical protein